MWEKYLGVAYRLDLNGMYHVSFLNGEVAKQCTKQWKESKFRNIYYKNCSEQEVFNLIEEYRRIEYALDSDKYLQAVNEFSEIDKNI